LTENLCTKVNLEQFKPRYCHIKTFDIVEPVSQVFKKWHFVKWFEKNDNCLSTCYWQDSPNYTPRRHIIRPSKTFYE